MKGDYESGGGANNTKDGLHTHIFTKHIMGLYPNLLAGPV